MLKRNIIEYFKFQALNTTYSVLHNVFIFCNWWTATIHVLTAPSNSDALSKQIAQTVYVIILKFVLIIQDLLILFCLP
jgi:hypothetical protein